jgi:hypothetical protein
MGHTKMEHTPQKEILYRETDFTNQWFSDIFVQGSPKFPLQANL